MADNKQDNKPLVLVTGASGYVAGHIIRTLAARGKYRIRGTVRSKKKYGNLGAQLAPKDTELQLDLAEADLMEEKGWAEAVKGVSYVIHTASPFTLSAKTEDELVKPAVNGVLNVLRACKGEAGVKRVVQTTSCVAIGWGWHNDPKMANKTFTEEDWSNEEHIDFYGRSKVRAEKAAWKFMEEEKPGFDLVTVAPSFITGPLIRSMECESAAMPARFMNREYPMVPRLNFHFVDVRDVAEAHVRAFEVAEAKGRYICNAHYAWMPEISNWIAAEFKKYGYNPPTKTLPTPVAKLVGVCDKDLRGGLQNMSAKKTFDNSKIVKDLDMKFIDGKQSWIDACYALMDTGYIEDKRKK